MMTSRKWTGSVQFSIILYIILVVSILYIGSSSSSSSSSVVVVVLSFTITRTTTSTAMLLLHYYKKKNNQYVKLLSVSRGDYNNDDIINNSNVVNTYNNNNNSNNTNNALLILGFGRVGREVTKQVQDRNLFTSIIGTIRNNTNNKEIEHKKHKYEDNVTEQNNNNNNNKKNNSVFIINMDVMDQQQQQQSIIHFILTMSNTICITHILVSIPPNSDPIINDALNKLYDTILRTCSQSIIMNSTTTTTTTTTITSSSLRWIGIISTTGVYGNHNGAYVTEESELVLPDIPSTSSSSSTNTTNTSTTSSSSSQYRYIQYEQEWERRVNNYIQQQQQQQHDPNHHNLTLNIFRSAGIYSHDQSALHTMYNNQYQQQQQPKVQMIATSMSAYNDITNRIHVYDLASIIVASMMTRTPSTTPLLPLLPLSSTPTLINSNSTTSTKCTWESFMNTTNIYNCADDLPESRTIVMQYATQLLQQYNITTIPNPKKSTPLLPITNNISITTTASTTTTRSSIRTIRDQRRISDSKRVSNDKIKQLLYYVYEQKELRYPTYIQGLKDIVVTSFYTNSTAPK